MNFQFDIILLYTIISNNKIFNENYIFERIYDLFYITIFKL